MQCLPTSLLIKFYIFCGVKGISPPQRIFHVKTLHQTLTLANSDGSETPAPPRNAPRLMNDDAPLSFSTRTCLFTAANDRSHKCFHRYVQRDINSSHLLHKAHSEGGQSRGHREHGDTYCTLSSNTPVLPPTEKGQRHGGDRERRGDERRDLDFYSNTKEHVKIA